MLHGHVMCFGQWDSRIFTWGMILNFVCVFLFPLFQCFSHVDLPNCDLPYMYVFIFIWMCNFISVYQWGAWFHVKNVPSIKFHALVKKTAIVTHAVIAWYISYVFHLMWDIVHSMKICLFSVHPPDLLPFSLTPPSLPLWSDFRACNVHDLSVTIVNLTLWTQNPSSFADILNSKGQIHKGCFNSLRMDDILRKLQKVMKLTQKWKDFENNGTTWKLNRRPFQ
jgi:hypothetical protein